MLSPYFTTFISRVPVWVLPLFVGLMVLGWLQTKQRKLTRTRVLIMPLVMLAFSLFSVLSLFGASALALLAWALGLCLGAALVFRFIRRDGMQFDANKNQFTLPGSYLPWGLILGIFSLRFVVGAMSASGAASLHSAIVVGSIALAGGFFSGCFSGRALALLQTQMRQHSPGGVTTA
jgi:hypothetical protein